MTLHSALKFLETSSSGVIKKTIFKRKATIYIPDFFFILFFVSLFIVSAQLDRLLIFVILFGEHHAVAGILLCVFSCAPFIYFFFLGTNYRECCTYKTCVNDLGFKQVCRCLIKLFLVVFGLDAALIGPNILSDALKLQTGLGHHHLRSDFLLFFHIPNEGLSQIKIYCLILTVVKCIPFLLITCIYLLDSKLTGHSVAPATPSILLNSIIFALTMAITFPIRKIPRIFKSCPFVIFNSSSKFMATLCACGLNLTVFALVFSNIKYYALLVWFLKILGSIWPCWNTMRTQTYTCSKVYIILYGFFLVIIFSFIYIHPFSGRGKLFYYYFYLVNFLLDIASIFLLTDADYDYVVMFLTLRILEVGFVTCFGFVNFFYTDKEEILQKINANSIQPLISASERSPSPKPGTSDSPVSERSSSLKFVGTASPKRTSYTGPRPVNDASPKSPNQKKKVLLAEEDMKEGMKNDM